MFFRTESLSAGGARAPLATMVKAVAVTLGRALADLFGPRRRNAAETLTLSAHDLRDIGLDPDVAGQAIAYDLLDVMPRSVTFGHRRRR